MSTKEIAKRYVLFIISLFFAALGVAVTKHGELGVSPISSVANVMSGKFEAVSLGYWLILWNSVLILGQIVILRREFKMIELLQIPLSFLFGWFTNFGMYCVSIITALLTGCVVKFFVGWLEKPINGILADKESVRGK